MVKNLTLKLGKLRTKQSELEFQISLREEAIQSINIELGGGDCETRDDSKLGELK